MNENKPLPKGWEVKNLGEVCEIFNGSTPLKRKKEYWENGTINWFTISDIRKQGRVIKFTNQRVTKKGFESTSLKILPVNSILLCCTASIGEFAITRIELTTNQQFNGLVVKNNKQLLPEYLFYFSSILKKTLLNVSGRATIDFVSMTKVRNIQIPLPPLSEQKCIVAILDKTFAEITKAEAIAKTNLQNAKELFESYLNNVFENKGDDWEEKTFEKLSSKIGDGLHGTPQYDENGEYFFINGNNLNDGAIEIREDTKRINKEEFEKHKRDLTNNTVLISINGTLGKVAFYNDEPVILGKSACYINFNDGVNKHYIKYLVKNPLFFKNMASLSTGATIKNFSLKSMRNYTLALPSITEQKQIVIQLDQLQTETKKLETIYQQKLTNLAELKKSILQKAFNGEL